DRRVFATPNTIPLAGGQLALTNTGETETMTGPKAGVTVSGGGLSRGLQVDGGVTASLSGMTITGGKAPGTFGAGGGVNNLGTLTLTNCTVSGNATGTFGSGGGVNNSGSLTLGGCSVSGNSAYAGCGLSN